MSTYEIENRVREESRTKKKSHFKNDLVSKKFKGYFTQELVRYLYDYNHETGLVTAKIARGDRKKGTIVGSLCSNGYLIAVLSINNVSRSIHLHRLAWLWWYGYLPENDIDHINRDKTDNRLCNLREVSRSCNMRNARLRSNNTSGIKGVGFYKPTQKWCVQINPGRGTGSVRVGYHTDFTEAVCHRYAAEQCLSWNDCDSNSPAYQYLKEQGVLK